MEPQRDDWRVKAPGTDVSDCNREMRSMGIFTSTLDVWRLKLRHRKASFLLRERQIFGITLDGTGPDALEV
ncbi:hypothetical protein [Synechococcus sp. MIT S1220]|uniref:hypothetical protein n=1 Tax=Synechococcus sp. MIT S1220 TaxID=3082549 RepID=UPI0039B0CCAE